MENFLLEWPDTAQENLNLSNKKIDSTIHALWAIRSGTFSHVKIQSYLLSQDVNTLTEHQDRLVLLGFFHFFRFDLTSFASVLSKLRSIAPERLEVRVLSILFWLWQDDISAISCAPSGLWSGLEKSLLLRICKSFYLLKLGQIDNALGLVHSLNDPPLEVYLLRAKALAFQENYSEAVNLLKSVRSRAKSNLRFWKQLVQYQIDARDGSDIRQNIAEALSYFGEHPQLLYLCTALNLFQRQPGLARRSALLQQIWSSVTSTPIVVGNQVNSYEGNGASDWIEHLLPSVTALSLQTDAQLHSNLIMQLASSESKKYKDHVNKLVSLMSSEPEFKLFRNAQPGVPIKSTKVRDQLKIAWISGDLDYHPVSRFLLGFFASSKGALTHSHEIISTQDVGPTSLVNFFRQDCGINVLQLSGKFNASRVSAIRSREYDIAIDLSGWTGGNFVAGFLSRLAPIQVNYLGYFASTGLPTMDYWIGDHSLFPDPMSEWSAETVFRLSRPFLAWKPVAPLPEADVDISAPPSGPIRFGSFNHNRKFSDRTLKLWGMVLDCVPGSRLVLKASNPTDSDTQRLLRRRMHRQGLDPERVDWLDLTKGPIEHLHQYSQIDIALDPLPNGGCTTTCEALWMGVPTVTLAGNNYVSRMSTAVLSGAEMSDWIAQDVHEYIQLASGYAADLNQLRNKRHDWRVQLAQSPLGNPLDLMIQLEDAFSRMYANR